MDLDDMEDLSGIIKDLEVKIHKASKKNQRKSKRFLKRWTYYGDEGYGKAIEMSKEIFLGASDFDDFVKAEVVK